MWWDLLKNYLLSSARQTKQIHFLTGLFWKWIYKKNLLSDEVQVTICWKKEKSKSQNLVYDRKNLLVNILSDIVNMLYDH